MLPLSPASITSLVPERPVVQERESALCPVPWGSREGALLLSPWACVRQLPSPEPSAARAEVVARRRPGSHLRQRLAARGPAFPDESVPRTTRTLICSRPTRVSRFPTVGERPLPPQARTPTPIPRLRPGRPAPHSRGRPLEEPLTVSRRTASCLGSHSDHG